MVKGNRVTVRDLLNLDCMQKVKIVAGEEGLERTVANVNVMEVPDIGEWVRPGDLLMTTAYSIRDNLEAQTTLIPQLFAKGLAALALKPKRYLDVIPSVMIEQAKELGFPLLELPVETSFSDIINPVLCEILQTHTEYLRKSEEAHHLFMEVILKGGKIEDIAQALAGCIENSVIIFDESGKILAKALVSWEDRDLAKLNKEKSTGLSQVIDPLGAGVKYYKTLVSSGPLVHEYRTDIIASAHVRGSLAVWDNQRPLTQNDFIFIDRAMAVSALEILNEKSLVEVERRYRNEFLDDLLHGSRSEETLLERARYLGWDLTLNYCALVIDIDDFRGYTFQVGQNEQTIQTAKEKLFRQVVNSIYPEEKFISGTKSDSIILLLGQPPGRPLKGSQEYIKRRAAEILRSIENCIKDFTVSIGVGRLHTGIPGLRRSYAEAVKALSIGQNLLGQHRIVHFEQLGIYRLLQQISNIDELESFYQETIWPLDHYDKQSSSDLVKTLNAYFQCGGNLTQVAKTLFVHYNTILYRIERIEEITSLNLKSPEDRLNLLIGLKIRTILKK